MLRKMLALAIPGIIIVIAIVVGVMCLIAKLLWGWVVPDLFPGAVSEGLVTGSISWWTAFKLVVCAALVGGGIRGAHVRVGSTGAPSNVRPIQ